MSDLAPLVIATIRDRVVVDQQHEIDQLREQLRQAQMIAVTEPGGNVVYAEETLGQGFSERYGTWTVNLQQRKGPISLGDFRNAELHVCGIMRSRLLFDTNEMIAETWIDEYVRQRGGQIEVNIYFGEPTLTWVGMELGPNMTEDDFEHLHQYDPESVLDYIVDGSFERQRSNKYPEPLRFTVKSVFFPGHAARRGLVAIGERVDGGQLVSTEEGAARNARSTQASRRNSNAPEGGDATE
uniref:Uncharacterized protein n=1 Tax=Grammatophora oceanica TaxID=210454 RepID=A0A7S1Y8J2_9STRA|mmetsp:Transcript_30983/g.45954  ORF Transcript_30983/g.45954 Transcript_30983/m.45954 type:complete len:240 (+) Transcript_30983:139-858(+)|eukprot:CAMPEP_0194027630 /NCGR_PEP_ID=MMETSP0009_2-20130614/1760_1 /TAXON_ID=210454 /ORGANISM="Grammatophora oceanica, Strain CCMP 410" /LENGTH=239 /DNA_ID=CAMNT_0038666771 /DNA_START=92 /DNA_END=811 /DNA_ORIENTATION=-